jgi:hypothetical protein
VGYPIVTGTSITFATLKLPKMYIFPVPLGFFPDTTPIEQHSQHLPNPAPGLPFGLSFLGTAFSEFDLISFAYAYEQATLTRLKRKAYTDAIPQTQLRDVVESPELKSVHQFEGQAAFGGKEYVLYNSSMRQRVAMTDGNRSVEDGGMGL